MTNHSSNTIPEYYLVKLFRTYQALHDAVQDERLALLRLDYQRLKSLAESRPIYLDTIERLECGRNLWWPDCIPAVQSIHPQKESTDFNRSRLQCGIETLIDVIQEWAICNQRMAQSVLMRIEATKAMLIQQNETLHTNDPAWQSPGRASILLLFRAQETILQGILEGNDRLENIKKSFVVDQEAENLKVGISSPLTGP